MPAPKFSLSTEGTNPKYAGLEALAAEVNRVVGVVYDQANPEDRASAEASAAAAASDAAAADADRVAAAASATTASEKASEATLAALAAGAKLFAALADGEAGTANGEVFLVQEDLGTAVYERIAGAGVYRGRLAEGGAAQKARGVQKNARIANKAIVSFIFDDGYTSHYSTVAPLFEARDVRCGFAINSAMQEANFKAKIREMLDLQSRGFEICNHSAGHENLTANTVNPKLAESEIVGGFRQLREYGFDVQTYVAANSTVHEDFIKYIERDHASAYTQASGAAGPAALTGNDAYRMSRLSMYSAGVAGAKTAIDAAIANDGYLCLYDHDPSQVNYAASLNTSQITEILDYAIAQGVRILLPRDAIDEINSGPLKSRKIEAISKEAGRPNAGVNLARDSQFRNTATTVPADTTIWDWYPSKPSNVATGGVTGAIQRSDLNSRITLSLDTGHTANTGNVLFQSLGKVKIADDAARRQKVGALCFSVDLSSPSAGVNDKWRVQLGIQVIRQSDGVVVGDAVETPALWLGSYVRRYHVAIAPEYYSVPVALHYYVRMTPLTTGDAADIVVANPLLNKGVVPVSWTPDIWGQSKGSFANTTFDTSTINNYSRTKLALNAAETDDFVISAITDDVVAKATGMYHVNARVKLTDAGLTTGKVVQFSLRKSGSTADLHICEAIAINGAVVLSLSYTTKLAAGEGLTFWAYQTSGAAITHTTSTASPLNVARVG